MLTAVSKRVESYLGRGIETTERTEVFDLELGQKRLLLYAYPLVSVDGVWNDPNREFGEETAASNVDVLGPSGVLLLDRASLYPGESVLQVAYTGGMTDDGATDPTDSFISLYPDIAHAVDLQVCEMWRRKTQPGASNYSYPDGSTAYDGGLKLLPFLKDVLDPLRRVMLR